MDRLAYALRRLAQMVPVVLGVTILVFFLIHLIPGDPAVTILGVRATPALVAELHRQWGLDRSLPEQYLLFMQRLLHGDLGTSLFYRVPVSDLIRDKTPVTVLLLIYAGVLALVIAVPLALLAATKKDGARDHVVRAVPLVGLGMPPFWIGIMLILLLAADVFKIFPVGGYGSGPVGHLDSLFLPALTIAIGIAPILIRSLRASLLTVLESDFVTTAHAKGLPGRRVLVRHAFRNAVLAMISVLTVNLGFLVGGTIVIEKIFALPGLGALMFDGISSRDFAVVQGVTLVFAILVVLVNLISDIVYSLLDPRVRFD
jgi:peptide/nickel transport system permease protein